MATQLMKDWIVELHNPERKQGHGELGRLNADGSHNNCCLGVLCEVKGVQGVPSGEPLSDGSEQLTYLGRSGLAPTEIIDEVLGRPAPESRPEWIGSETLDLYEHEETDWDGYEVTVTVTADEANDEHDLSFKQIAEKLSERYLSGEERFEVRKRIEDLGWA